MIWEQGLTISGNSLSNGIAGNGYCLHTLYRHCKRISENLKPGFGQQRFYNLYQKYQTRAYYFAKALVDPQVQSQLQEQVKSKS